MASEHYCMKLEAFNITCHQLTLPTTMVVPVPVRPENETRPFSRGGLILQAITPLCVNRVWPRKTRTVQYSTVVATDMVSHQQVK